MVMVMVMVMAVDERTHVTSSVYQA